MQLKTSHDRNHLKPIPGLEAEQETLQGDRFRLLVDSVRDYAIVILDPEGRVTTWNAGAARMKGYEADEIIGQHFSRFYPAEDAAEARPERELAIAAATGQVEHEGWRVRKDGSRFWANVVITAIHDDTGQLRGFGKVVRDMTERKQHERELEEKNAALQDAVNGLEAFSYSVSHDLRAPLRAIDGFSRILLKENASTIDPQSLGYLQFVRDNAIQMGHLVDDLLAFSRLSRTPLKKQIVPTAGLVAKILRDQASDGRSVSVTVGELPDIWGDPALLKQVLVNLIDNAFKYTQMREGARIEIGARRIEGEQVIFVRDNGVGFDMQYAGKLFGVFQRLHRAEDFEGTGVGLAIVQRIIQRHGKRVWAEAAVDQGATFYFTMEASCP